MSKEETSEFHASSMGHLWSVKFFAQGISVQSKFRYRSTTMRGARHCSATDSACGGSFY
jgi:hypothetical protein